MIPASFPRVAEGLRCARLYAGRNRQLHCHNNTHEVTVVYTLPGGAATGHDVVDPH